MIRENQNQAERTTPGDLPSTAETSRCDSYQQMHSEIYGSDLSTQISQHQKLVTQELNGVLSHLQTAEDLLERSDRSTRFKSEYTAAIQSADQIDQNAVKKERAQIQQLLQVQGLDARTRTQLMSEDADLHLLERAPGFARANYALNMIRNGDYDNGSKLLSEASQLDIEMKGDANFQRHLKSAVDFSRTLRVSDSNSNRTPSSDLQPPSPVESVQTLFPRVTGPGTMTPEMKVQFQQSIVRADATPSPKLGALLQAEAVAANALRPLSEPNLAGAVKAQDAAAQSVVQKITPQENRDLAVQLYNAMDKASLVQERQSIQQQLIQLNPAFRDILGKRDQIMGAANIENLIKYNSIENSLQAEANQAAVTRFTFGFALAKNGDLPEAKQFVDDAIKLNRSTDAELRDFWQRTSAQLGNSIEASRQQPQTKTDQTKPNQATDAAPKNAPDISSENQGLRPDQIMLNAQRALQQNGMNENTKRQFEDAIKAADAVFGAKDQKMTEQLLQVLRTNTKADGSTLTSQERVQAHQLISQEFAAATLGVRFRTAYGALLSENKQYASAEKVLKENITIADKLPLGVFQAELSQLGRDVQNPSLSRADQADLFAAMQTIQGSGTAKDDGLMYTPINARKMMARFYMSGAAHSDGTGLLKPELAAAMLDDSSRKIQELYQVAPDQVKKFDPSLTAMYESINPFLPETLRKQKATAVTQGSDALLDGGIGAAVLTGAGVLASIATHNPNFAKWALTADGKALSLSGKLALGTTALATATGARHYAHEAVVGESESWNNSAIHGTASLAGTAALVFTRGKMSKLLGTESVAAEAAAATKPGFFKNGLTGYSSGVAALGTYKSITALDAPLDPATGKQLNYWDSLKKAHWNGYAENTATEAILLTGLLRTGKPTLPLVDTSSALGKLSFIKAPLRMINNTSRGAGYIGTEAGAVTLGTTVYNFSNLMSGFNSYAESRKFNQALDAEQRPIIDQTGPVTKIPQDLTKIGPT